MKVIVIGCTHAGTAAVINMRELYPDSDIVVYERNDNISFLSCGIALYVGGVVKEADKLFYSSPEQLQKLNIKAQMQHNVADVDFAKKEIQVEDIKSGIKFTESYDKLVITTGSWPIVPKIEGIELGNIVLCKNYDHSKVIIEKAKTAQNITIIGGGYIGVELVESFVKDNKNVTLIESEDRIMAKYLDREFTDMAEQELREAGAKLAVGETAERFLGEHGNVAKVMTNKGMYETDLVILCIGFRPSTSLFKDHLEMTSGGAIIVDPYMKTSQPDVFAAGDCCAVFNNAAQDYTYIPLATNAVRMGTLVARNLLSDVIKSPGTQGTSGIKIDRYNIASTGLTVSCAKNFGIEAKSITITENNRPEFMPTFEELKFRLVYEVESRRVIGAQLISKADLTQSINTISVAIQNQMTVEELAFVDFFFLPHYNKPWNFINTACLAAK